MAKKANDEAMKSLWDALDVDDATPPPNAITAHDYMKRYGVTRDAAAHRLNRGVGRGELKSGLFRAPGGGPRILFYWLPEKKT
jgi:hypothetical protein